jgi:hypothetical protein
VYVLARGARYVCGAVSVTATVGITAELVATDPG